MFYFKACKTCGGDLSLDRDSYGSFLRCLQCGGQTEVKAKELGVYKTETVRPYKVAA